MLSACSGDLLPGELVVPGELPTQTYRGTDGSSLGAGVALDDGVLLAGAPGTGEILQPGLGIGSQGPAGLGRWVWWHEGRPWAARASVGVYEARGDLAALAWETPSAVCFAAGPTHDGERVASATALGVQLWGYDGVLEASLSLEGVQRLAIGWERVIMLRCDGGGCEALGWRPGDAEVSRLGTAGDGGAVTELDGVAWWGDPEQEIEQGNGLVCAESGTCIEGLPGDHLGRSLCPGYAAGIHNSWILPGRLRVMPLQDGPVLAVDSGVPGRPAALACEEGRVAVGLPSDGLHARGEGRVLVAETGD